MARGRVLRTAALDRLKGRRPSPLRALLGAATAAAAAGVITFKALRK
jgi:hypothetical protein